MDDRFAALASTPEPPYYAVIFTRVAGEERDGYGETADRMVALAARQPGFLGVESVSEPHSLGGAGITVSYWADAEAVARWRAHPDHVESRARGRADWYAWYELRVATVERVRSFEAK